MQVEKITFQAKAGHPGISVFTYARVISCFCSCDLDLDLMTLIYEFDLDILKM